MDAGVEARLQAGGVTFGAADAELLRAVADHGSVSGAAESLGRSRARALNRLEKLEEAFGSLVERRRGGADGGGSRLAPDARTLLAQFDRLRAAVSGTAAVPETVLDGRVVNRDGEVGTIETDAGTVRALLIDDAPTGGPPATEAPPDVDSGGRVQVSVRADAITLYDPEDAPPSGGTSARNRFSGTVARIDPGRAIAHVAVDVGTTDALLALVTGDSLDQLALETGDGVVAAFKTTATRATPAGR